MWCVCVCVFFCGGKKRTEKKEREQQVLGKKQINYLHSIAASAPCFARVHILLLRFVHVKILGLRVVCTVG